MASLSIQKSYEYDVFLSFSGEDTRKTFVDHLYDALRQQGIHTYKDDEQLKKGRRIKEELLKSIENSVFSNYELVKIMECHKSTDQIAHPVFYDVSPSEVRKQHGAVGEAFAKHHKEENEQWREALEEAGNLAGWVLSNTADGHEAKFIKKIVEEISLDLCSINLKANKKLIGMESRIKDIVSSLEIGVDDVRMVGIKGMGGGGKTTLAKAVYDHICYQFEVVSFVENVREVSKAPFSGLKSLQKQVLSDVLHDHGITISSVSVGKNMMKRKLCGRKVLLVLDDVDHLDQLEALAGATNWFKPGSRIIITTRDAQVLVAHRVKWIHNVNLLMHEEAICLFSRYAFGRDTPIQGYKRLAFKVLRYAAGLPLTIRVLGSFLCGKNELEWIDALERLKTIPLKETLEILEVSYIGLEDSYKEIFLDVACHLKGAPKTYAIKMLESCGFHARNALRVLEQKSLITMSNCDQYLGMHDHLEEMGWNIVRRLHPDEPNKHSRLWIQEEINDILANNLGTEEIRCIQAWQPLKVSPEIAIKGFGNMKKLRFLSMASFKINFDVKIDEVSQNFPNALRFLSWEGYPHWSLPRLFLANNLVTLEMPYSRIAQLWGLGRGRKKESLGVLYLTELHLSVSDRSVRCSDNGLPMHWLKFCYKEPPSSFRNIEKLVSLDGCCTLENFSEGVCCLQHLRKLTLNGSIAKIPMDIDYLECLEELHLSCTHIKLLPESICTLKHLKSLELKSCFGLQKLPEDIFKLEKLEKLSCSNTGIKFLPDSICMLETLKYLKIDAKFLEKLPGNLGRLESLEKFCLSSAKINNFPDSICMLRHLRSLEVKSCVLRETLPKDFGWLQYLEKIYLSYADIEYLPDSICMLKRLKSLKLILCWKLKKLPDDIGQLECLENLILSGCESLEYIPNSICKINRLRYFCLLSCTDVVELPEEIGCLKCLEELDNTSSVDHLDFCNQYTILGWRNLLLCIMVRPRMPIAKSYYISFWAPKSPAKKTCSSILYGCIDPVVPVKTKGRPKRAIRVKPGFEVSLDLKKKNSCGYCGKKRS
ncbi:disease resistance protein (TIR-NBS-LRR class) [Artemisia annua]|uniref:Disease resistance protein (TIR-NBS-LRR class) n=1 Tax=Artemisia annua TaxID=35608 RepID=A0A2U1L4H5_ARTAN|nr:disease resistance protein (TIR-NBS-LRR class) [Artemisia annua]